MKERLKNFAVNHYELLIGLGAGLIVGGIAVAHQTKALEVANVNWGFLFDDDGTPVPLSYYQIEKANGSTLTHISDRVWTLEEMQQLMDVTKETIKHVKLESKVAEAA